MKRNPKERLYFLAGWIIFYPLLLLFIASESFLNLLFSIYGIGIFILVIEVMKS